MPSTDHDAGLHHAFAQWKSKVRTEVFNRIKLFVISEYRDPKSVRLYGMPQALGRDFRQTCNPDPLLCLQILHRTNDILTAFDFVPTLSTYEN